ncbi:GntR family transcriptional regulator [Amycolatopsis nigrescens]|uniref:GntR family transcriptional regulator n=1 Tax=Amycolatopsis nigrescens TaxID=381445 RepID=UPI0003803B2D|nr:winged helix-turn-helix domain-containing protein [Amycolatopsis nigrescens]
MPELDPDDSNPSYRRVADELRVLISLGTYGPGDKLPSYETAAKDFGVSIGTVKRAFAVLQQENVIVIRPGLGSFVRTRQVEDGGNPDLLPLADIQGTLSAILHRLDAIERALHLR